RAWSSVPAFESRRVASFTRSLAVLSAVGIVISLSRTGAASNERSPPATSGKERLPAGGRAGRRPAGRRGLAREDPRVHGPRLPAIDGGPTCRGRIPELVPEPLPGQVAQRLDGMQPDRGVVAVEQLDEPRHVAVTGRLGRLVYRGDDED